MEALSTGKTLSLVDHTILLSKDGTPWPLDYSVSPIRNVDHAVVGCVLVFREISKRKKEEEAQAERSRMVSLRADLGTALSSIQDKSQALEHVCSAIVKHLDVVVGTIWVLNDKTLEVVASAGLPQRHDENHGGPQLGFSMAHRIVLIGSPLIANSTSDSWQVEDGEWTHQQGIEAFAGYPLLVDGQVIGAMAIFSSKPLPASTLEEMLPLADSIAQFIDRKRIEERLRESEEQVRMSLEASSLGTWHVEPKTVTLVTDKRFREIFGRRNERLTYQQAFDCIHPDDQSRVAEAMKASTRVDNPLPYVIEYRVIHPNGMVRWVSAKGRSTYANGQLVSFDGTVSDCTDRKTVEELRSEFESNFRVLVDNIPQLAWIAQPGSDGRIIWFNQNCYEYSGSTLEEMQHTVWHSIIHHEHAERVIRKFRDHVRANMDWEATFPLRRRDGESTPHLGGGRSTRVARRADSFVRKNGAPGRGGGERISGIRAPATLHPRSNLVRYRNSRNDRLRTCSSVA